MLGWRITSSAGETKIGSCQRFAREDRSHEQPNDDICRDASANEISRRGLIGLTAAAGATVAFGAAPAMAQTGIAGGANSGRAADLVLVNGRIHTMDGADTVTDAVAIRGWPLHCNRRASGRNGGECGADGQPRRQDRLSRPHRTALSHRQCLQPAGLSHDPGEHDQPRRCAEGACRTAQGCAGGRMDHVAWRVSSKPVGGHQGAADPPAARSGGTGPAGLPLHAFHRPGRHQQPGQAALRRVGQDTGASEHRHGRGRR